MAQLYYWRGLFGSICLYLYSVVSFTDSANGDDGVCCLSDIAWVIFDLFICLIDFLFVLAQGRLVLLFPGRFLFLNLRLNFHSFFAYMGEYLFFGHAKKRYSPKKGDTRGHALA